MKNKIQSIRSRFLNKFLKEKKERISKSKRIWNKNKKIFRNFWKEKVMNNRIRKLSIEDVDRIIRIIDTKASGKKRGEEAVALIGIRQGGWRYAFKNIKENEKIKNKIDLLLNSKKSDEQIRLLNDIEKMCVRDHLRYIVTKNGAILNSLMFINDPKNNISMVSLKDRYQLISFFKLGDIQEIMTSSFGEKLIRTRDLIVSLRKKIGVKTNKILCDFLYFEPVKSEWKIIRVPEKRPEYGEIINFRGFVYAPVNHEGTVALFGAIANDLGFNIEKIRKNYPDIEAVYKGKKVNIEVEYINSEFDHDPKGCDILVCWRKDIKICPIKKVIELKEEINKIKNL